MNRYDLVIVDCGEVILVEKNLTIIDVIRLWNVCDRKYYFEANEMNPAKKKKLTSDKLRVNDERYMFLTEYSFQE